MQSSSRRISMGICKFMSLGCWTSLLKTFIELHYRYCSLVWMICGTKSNNCLIYLHKKGFTVVFNDSHSYFEDFLRRDCSILIIIEIFRHLQ